MIDDLRNMVTLAFTDMTLSYMGDKMDETKLLSDYVVSSNQVIDVKTKKTK